MGKGNRSMAKEGFDAEDREHALVGPVQDGEAAQRHADALAGAPRRRGPERRGAEGESGLSQQLPTLDKVSANLGRPPPSPSVSNLSSVCLSPVGSDRTR
ncbi:unnamed protein product [Prorocentrum cordatum]|uniref:Uncharacterized protein n=1 Tax=Prorocentrum cordatum TaxID=2364126 RepID=A0ABN9T653_9DINO|nr:unnamed protein product [Polarella glacialis]